MAKLAVERMKEEALWDRVWVELALLDSPWPLTAAERQRAARIAQDCLHELRLRGTQLALWASDESAASVQ